MDVCKWLINSHGDRKSFKDRVAGPLPNRLYKWCVNRGDPNYLLTGWDDPPSRGPNHRLRSVGWDGICQFLGGHVLFGGSKMIANCTEIKKETTAWKRIEKYQIISCWQLVLLVFGGFKLMDINVATCNFPGVMPLRC